MKYKDFNSPCMAFQDWKFAMVTLSKDIKLLTLSLVLRTMPKEQQSLLLAHFSPEVVKALSMIEQATGVDIEKLDWTPLYQTWPELKKILDDCRKEIKIQKQRSTAGEQRPKIREYMQIKLGKQRKGAPIFLTQDVMQAIDQYLEELKQD